MISNKELKSYYTRGHRDYVRILRCKEIDEKNLEKLVSSLLTDGWKEADKMNFHWQDERAKLKFMEGKGDEMRMVMHNNSGAVDKETMKNLYDKLCRCFEKQKIKYELEYKEG